MIDIFITYLSWDGSNMYHIHWITKHLFNPEIIDIVLKYLNITILHIERKIFFL